MLFRSNTLRDKTNFYTKDLLEILFVHPYTRIESISNKLKITRQTASKYLKKCEELKIVQCIKMGKNNYYVNVELCEIFRRGIC